MDNYYNFIKSDLLSKVITRLVSFSISNTGQNTILRWFKKGYENKILKDLDKGTQYGLVDILNNFSNYENDFGRSSSKLYHLIATK